MSDTIKRGSNETKESKKALKKRSRQIARNDFRKNVKKQKVLIAMSIPFVIYLIIFKYIPIWGWLMAFQDFKPNLGISGSEWVGFKHFMFLFTNEDFFRVMRNTLAMSTLKLTTGVFSAVTLAILLNEVGNLRFKKTVQTVSYLPHFISWVVASNIVLAALSTDGGIINEILVGLGLVDKPILFMGIEKYFWGIITISNIWKEVGWSAIIYLAAMTAIDPQLYEAAQIDGAGRLKRIWHITLPGIMPTVIILLILKIGWILNAGFEQQYLLQNPTVLNVSEVLSIFVLRYGIGMGRYSFATAAGIFQSIVSLTLVFTVNWIAKKTSDDSVV